MRNIFKIFIIVCMVSVLGVGMAEARTKKYTYHYHDNGDVEPTYKTKVTIKNPLSDKTVFTQTVDNKGLLVVDTVKVDDQYETMHWHRKVEGEDTEYTVENLGDDIVIQGTLKGETVEKTLPLKGKPFYSFPRLNLSKFALSKQPQLKIVTLRRDNLTKLTLQAKNKGEEVVEVNGKEQQAIKVYFSARGVKEKYYNRYYYYRKSDGVFLKKVEPKGDWGELAREK